MRPFGDLPGDDPERDARRAAEEDRQRAEERRETAAALEAAGIELDPTPPGTHRHGDLVHPSDHAHPHVHAEAGQPPVTGIVGAGRWDGAWRGAVTGRLADPRRRQSRRGRRERFRAS